MNKNLAIVFLGTALVCNLGLLYLQKNNNRKLVRQNEMLVLKYDSLHLQYLKSSRKLAFISARIDSVDKGYKYKFRK